MTKKGIKVSACILSTTLLLSGNSMFANATGVSGSLPAAGLGLALEEGSSLKEVKEEVKDIVKNSSDTSTAIKADNGMVSVGEAVITADKEIVEPIVATISSPDEIANEVKEDFSSLVIARVNDYVNVRDIPSEDGEVVGKLYDKSVGNFIEEENGWYKIESGNCTGYVKAEYCVTGDDAVNLAKEVGTRIATVTTTTLKVREEPSMDAPVLGLIPIDDELTVSEEIDGWVKVDIEEGSGYVSNEFVSLSTEFVKAESKEEEEARLQKEKEARDAARAAAAAKANENVESSDNSSTQSSPAITVSGSGTGSDVANYGLKFVGNPYVYGGTSLTNGTDCSGFVMGVYANFGVSLPHSSAGDRNVGYDVGSIDNAQPGDLICYSGHVALYIGNGQIVHASTSKTGIIVSNASYRQPLAVRRIF